MNPARQSVLLVEDNPADARLLSELLLEAGGQEFTLQQTTRIQQALEYTETQKYDVILLDLTLPDGSGIETIQRVYAANPHVPIIVLTGLEDDSFAVEAVQNGAQDYLVKGQVSGALLVRSIRYAIERKKMEESLHFLALHDVLTNLPNRSLFQDHLSQAIDRAQRKRAGQGDKWGVAVVLLDLDNFKNVNDTLGHAVGDLLLKAVASRLQHSTRKEDTVARMGGDEFTLIFENVSGECDVKTVVKKILSAFSEPFQLDAHIMDVTASIGVSLYPFDGENAETLLKHADIAMYRAKRERNQMCFYHTVKDRS